MSRAGGLQSGTISKYLFLDKSSEDWRSTDDLVFLLSERYGHSYGYARRVVNTWAIDRAGRVQRFRAGRMTFFCSTQRMKPTPEVLSMRYWGVLPRAFRENRPGLRQHSEWLYITLLAYGWFVHRRTDCLVALNRQLKKFGFILVRKTEF